MKSVMIKSSPDIDKYAQSLWSLNKNQISTLIFTKLDSIPTISHACLFLKHDAWFDLFWHTYTPEQQTVYQTHNYNPMASCLLGAVYDKCRLIEDPHHLFIYLDKAKEFMFKASTMKLLTQNDMVYLQDETEFSTAILTSNCFRTVRLSPGLMTQEEKNKVLEQMIEKTDDYYQSLFKELERYNLNQNLPSIVDKKDITKKLKI